MYFNKVYIRVQLLYIILHTLKYLMQVDPVLVVLDKQRTQGCQIGQKSPSQVSGLGDSEKRHFFNYLKYGTL